MVYRKWGWVAVTGFLLLFCLSGTAVAQDEVTIEGPAIPFGELQGGEEGQLGQLSNQLEAAGYDLPPNVYFVLGGDQSEEVEYLVFANTTGHPGILSVTGQDASHVLGEEARSQRIIVAETSELEREGEPATREEVNSNIEEYRYQLVEMEVDYNQFAIQVGLSESNQFQQVALGEFGESSVLSSGETAVNASLLVMSTSMAEWDGTVMRQVKEGEELEPILHGGGPNWWSSGPSKIDVIVGGEDEFLVTKHRPVVTRKVDVDEIAAGEIEEGERVSVTSDTSGSAISIKQVMLKVAQCAPESVLAPVVQCMPLTTDATVHTGLMAEDQSVVAYTGVSNHRVDGLADVERGEYRLVGEVVSADEIDAEVPGQYALRVEYMEQKSSGEIPEELEQASEILKQRFIEEIGAVAGEQGKYREHIDEENVSEDRFSVSDDGADPTGTNHIEVTSIEYNPQYGEEGDVVRAVVVLENTGEKTAAEQFTIKYAGVVKYDRVVELASGEQQRFVVERRIEDNSRGAIIVNGERHGEIGHFPDGTTPSPTPTIAYGNQGNNQTSEDGGQVPAVILVLGISLIILRTRHQL